MPIEAGLVNRAIETRRPRSRATNFDIRKHVLRYDEVVNEQRNRIYDQRRRILTEPSLRLTVEDMIAAEVGDLVAQFTTGDYEDEWQLDELIQALRGWCITFRRSTPDRWQNMKRASDRGGRHRNRRQAYAAKEVELGEPILRNAEKQIMLWAVDTRWCAISPTWTACVRASACARWRSRIRWWPTGAKAFEMYGEMIDAIRSDTVRSVFSVQLQRQ